MNNLFNHATHLPSDLRRNPLRLPCDNAPDWWDIILR